MLQKVNSSESVLEKDIHTTREVMKSGDCGASLMLDSVTSDNVAWQETWVYTRPRTLQVKQNEKQEKYITMSSSHVSHFSHDGTYDPSLPSPPSQSSAHGIYPALGPAYFPTLSGQPGLRSQVESGTPQDRIGTGKLLRWPTGGGGGGNGDSVEDNFDVVRWILLEKVLLSTAWGSKYIE
ncbi:hypothetical protein BDP27DRAFT_1367942 [Rhodocollybia butyracea]|uniref:Uncharacterized protein n=1 Tax=Rhodocollybia butyracea TaxID=206335 RepID=A0A9P5PHZ0_9AGAR|nr:hypothetical protein BDP27DRAFT_1367942 [Rhodocollybia butyracea]